MMGLGLVTICTFQAMGKGLPALIMSLCRQGVVFAVVLSILSHLFGYMGILTSQLAADLVTTVIAAGLFLRYIKPELRMSTPQVLNN
jgi:Na+-driven multidrug efflux pump